MRVVLALLLASVPALGQVRGPAEVTVPIGRLASVPLTVDADQSDYLILGDVDGFREYDPDPSHLKLRVIGYAPGVSYVVVTSAKGGKLLPLVVVKVTVAGPAPVPPPGPGPDPVPPLPVDPLAAAVKAAAAKDGWPADKLRDLAARFHVAAARLDNRETVGDALAAAVMAMGSPDKTPPALKAVLGAELRALDGPLPPANPAQVLTQADRDRAKALLTRLAVACEGAAK